MTNLRTAKPIAVYAGSFDPITRGHWSVLEKAAPMFETLVCLVAVHPTKTPLLSPQQRVDLIRQVTVDLPNVRADSCSGYTVEYARRIGARVLVRGIRDGSDADYETSLAQANRELAPEIVSIFVPADKELARVSSSALRRLAEAGKDLTRFCHPVVADTLRQHFRTATVG